MERRFHFVIVQMQVGAVVRFCVSFKCFLLKASTSLKVMQVNRDTIILFYSKIRKIVVVDQTGSRSISKVARVHDAIRGCTDNRSA